MLRTLVEGHGKQEAGTYYNIAKKAEMTNNRRTPKAKPEIRNAWKTTRSPQKTYLTIYPPPTHPIQILRETRPSMK